MMRPLLIAPLLVAALAFAGCAEDTPAAVPPGQKTGNGTGAGTGAGDVPPTMNQAPTARLEASVTFGTAPLMVEFTVSGVDPDGTPLSWTLDVDGDGAADAEGQETPGNFSFTYETEGNFTARAELTDGIEKVPALVTISVAAALAPGATDPVVLEGTATGVDPALGEPIVHEFVVPAGVTGFTASLVWEPAVPGTDLDLYLLDASGKERASSACANFQPIPAEAVFTCNRDASEEAVVGELLPGDAGTWSASIIPYMAPDLAYKLTITFA